MTIGLFDKSTESILEALEHKMHSTPLSPSQSQEKLYHVIDMANNFKSSDTHQDAENVKKDFGKLEVSAADLRHQTNDGTLLDTLLLRQQQDKNHFPIKNQELIRLVIEAGCPVSKENIQQLTRMGHLPQSGSFIRDKNTTYPIHTAMDDGRNAQITAWENQFPMHTFISSLLDANANVTTEEKRYEGKTATSADKFNLLVTYGATRKELLAAANFDTNTFGAEVTLNALEIAHNTINSRIKTLAESISAHELMSSPPNAPTDLLTDIVHGVAKGTVPAETLHTVTTTCKKENMERLLKQTYDDAMQSNTLTVQDKEFLSATMKAERDTPLFMVKGSVTDNGRASPPPNKEKQAATQSFAC